MGVKRKKPLRNTPLKLCWSLSSPHFHLKLSAEVGAMFVSALIVLLVVSFPLNVSFQTGTAQRRGEATVPAAVTDTGWPLRAELTS